MGESGMIPALPGVKPSSLKQLEAPFLLFLSRFLSPCLGFPSPFPPRPPLLCGKISQYLVVCSPGHHQVQQPGLPLMFSPKSYQWESEQVESGGNGWSLPSREHLAPARLPVIRNPLGKRGQVWLAEEEGPILGEMMGKRSKETGGGWLPMKRDLPMSRETGGGWMPLGKRDRGTGGGWMPLGKRSLLTWDDEGRGKRWRQTDGFWSPMGKRRRSDEGEAQNLISWVPGDGVWDRVNKRTKGKWNRVMRSWDGEPKEKWTRVMRAEGAGGKWNRVMKRQGEVAKRGEEGEGKWSRVMRKRGENEENEDIEENEENHELELENPEEDGVLY